MHQVHPYICSSSLQDIPEEIILQEVDKGDDFLFLRAFHLRHRYVCWNREEDKAMNVFLHFYCNDMSWIIQGLWVDRLPEHLCLRYLIFYFFLFLLSQWHQLLFAISNLLFWVFLSLLLSVFLLIILAVIIIFGNLFDAWLFSRLLPDLH